MLSIFREPNQKRDVKSETFTLNASCVVQGRAYTLLGILLPIILGIGGCCSSAPDPPDPCQELAGVYLYQPLNPTTVWFLAPSKAQDKNSRPLRASIDSKSEADLTAEPFRKALRRDLTNEAVRVALNSLRSDGTFNAGVVGAVAQGQAYELVVDYIKYLTNERTIELPESVSAVAGKSLTVPIYLGVGVRIRAQFRVLQGDLSISGLPGLAIAANANAISGDLTVQTLGITGPEVTALMPLLSDISVASVQSAVQSVASIKSKLYEPDTSLYPMAIGFETPTLCPEVVRLIAEEIYANPEYATTISEPRPTNPEEVRVTIYWSVQPIRPSD